MLFLNGPKFAMTGITVLSSLCKLQVTPQKNAVLEKLSTWLVITFLIYLYSPFLFFFFPSFFWINKWVFLLIFNRVIRIHKKRKKKGRFLLICSFICLFIIFFRLRAIKDKYSYSFYKENLYSYYSIIYS